MPLESVKIKKKICLRQDPTRPSCGTSGGFGKREQTERDG